MESCDESDALLLDYPNRSVWTIWTISYNAVQEKNQAAAKLLLLWAFLDNKDLWYGLFTIARRLSPVAARKLSEQIGDIASNELKFPTAIQLLRNYSLIEDVEDLASYATHPVVHRWAYHFQSKDSRDELAQLAVIIMGWPCLISQAGTIQPCNVGFFLTPRYVLDGYYRAKCSRKLEATVRIQWCLSRPRRKKQ